MRFEYDKNADAAYIYFEHPLGNGQVKRTVELQENVILDYDDHGKLLGIEVLSASKVLGKKALIEAQGG